MKWVLPTETTKTTHSLYRWIVFFTLLIAVGVACLHIETIHDFFHSRAQVERIPASEMNSID